MLLTKISKVKWNSNTKKWFVDKGYIYTKMGDEFEVKVEDLSDGSGTKVKVKCDCCGKTSDITWADYKIFVKNSNKTYCRNCARKLYGVENSRKSRLKSSISFQDWCCQNLDKKEANLILSRWDTEKNGCTPNEVSYRSGGFDKKGYWFKCLDSLEHHSELKNISSFVNGHKGSITCNQCNSIGQWLLDCYGNNGIKLYWGNNNRISPFEIPCCGKKKVWIKCQECGNEKLIAFNNFINRGINCSKCGDGISYPNKIGFNILQQLSIDFVSEYNPNWIKPKRYDFYFKLNNKQYIIEMDGGFHTQDNTISGQTKEESKAIDKYKDKLANEHNIEVIRIDCDYKDNNRFEYIKNNILNSDLSKLFDLDCIDWKKCLTYAFENLVKVVCNLWEDGMKNTKSISNILGYNRCTIIKYLKQGALIGWCSYNPIDEFNKNHISQSKKVFCIELNKVFDSVHAAANITDIKNQNISWCCLGKAQSAGKHPTTGEKLHWVYYEDYLKQQNKIA